jgi:hypothetical protein
LSLNEASAILTKLSDVWSDNISSFLKDNGASSWETDVMNDSEFTAEIIELLDNKIFEPINCYRTENQVFQNLKLFNELFFQIRICVYVIKTRNVERFTKNIMKSVEPVYLHIMINTRSATPLIFSHK